jgi:Zn ribbon nucleic-acid-binding protein
MPHTTLDREALRRSDNHPQRETANQCPKCNARIGMYVTRAAVSEGLVAGVTCVLCGYWHQQEMTKSVITGSW